MANPPLRHCGPPAGLRPPGAAPDAGTPAPSAGDRRQTRAAGRPDLLTDAHADQWAVLRPGPVVVLHPPPVQQLMEDEPGVRAALTDAAVGDGVAVLVDTCLPVERA